MADDVESEPVVGDDAVLVRILSREKARTTRRAQRRRDEEPGEPRSFAREPIDVGRLQARMAGHAEPFGALVVGDDEYDVRLFFQLGGHDRQKAEQFEQGEYAKG